jgi:hypothetical protein
MLRRATLDEGPRLRVQWNKAILLVENRKYGPKGPRPTSDKLRLNLYMAPPVLEGKSIGSDPKKNKELKRELMIWRTKMQARVQGRIQLKGFNLLQMGPNWFLRIWTLLDRGPKWALV